MNLKNIESLDELEVGMKVWDKYGFEKNILEKLTNTVLLSHDNGREIAGEWRRLVELKKDNYRIEVQEWKPKEGEGYYYTDLGSDDDVVVYSNWENDSIDQHRSKYGLIFKTEEEAKARREEILKLLKK